MKEKEYKVEKITKYEALNKLNKEMRYDAFFIGLSTLAMIIFMGLSTDSIILFLHLFPLAYTQGFFLDNLDETNKQKKKILNLDDDDLVNEIKSKSNQFQVLTDEEIVELNEETRSIKR